MKIVVVGSLNMDIVVQTPRLPMPGETVLGRESHEIPGGKGANQAVAARRLVGSQQDKSEVVMVGRVGDDGFGERLRLELKQAGVREQHIQQTNACASGVAIVQVEDSGQNSITVVPGANGRLTPQDVTEAARELDTANALLVQLETPLAAVEAAVRESRARGLLTVLDPAPAPLKCPDWLFSVDVLCPNESEAAAITGRSIESLEDAAAAATSIRERGVKHAIVTLGERGCVLCDEDGAIYHVEPFAVEAIDTTAAGDAFAAAITVAISEGRSAQTAVRFASAAGALAASKSGAQPAMPTRADVESLIHRHMTS